MPSKLKTEGFKPLSTEQKEFLHANLYDKFPEKFQAELLRRVSLKALEIFLRNGTLEDVVSSEWTSEKKALELKSKGKPLLQEPKPDISKSCEDCLKYGGILAGKILCVTKKTVDKPTRIQKIPIIEARACADKSFNTPLNKKTREEFERDLKNSDLRTKYHQQKAEKLRPKLEQLSIAFRDLKEKSASLQTDNEQLRLDVEKLSESTLLNEIAELRPKAEQLPKTLRDLQEKTLELQEVRKPLEELISEKDTLKSRFSLMENTLLQRDEKIASLETDNEQLKLNLAELSESKLLDENDQLHNKLRAKDTLINDYKLEIRKVEALLEKEQKHRLDVIARVNQMLRDFKQYAPLTFEPYEAISYLKSVRKAIENFEGFLKTIEGKGLSAMET